jgi:hypothetical protein
MATTSTPKKKKSIFRRILKWTGITFLLLIAALIIIPIVFKDQLIQMAKDEANKNLNAKVDFGQFDLTLLSSFPDLRFKIDSVKVVGINDFAKDTLAYIGHTELEMDLMSVIKGDKYKIKQILLENPVISARVLSDGRANWDIMKPSADTATAAEDTAATKFDLGLNKLEIRNAVIKYNDESSAMKAALNNMDFTMNGDFTQDNFIMDIITEIKSVNLLYAGVPYAKDLRTKLKVAMDMDMQKMKFTFKDNEIGLNDLVLAVNGFFAMPKEGYDMDMKFSCKQTEFKSLLSLVPGVYTKDFASVQTKGKLALDGAVKGLYSEKTMPGFNAHLEIADAMFKYPSLPKSVNNINIKVDVNNPNGNPDATAIDIHRFHVEMAGNPLDMRMKVRTPVSDPSLDGEVKGKIDLASVKEFVPLEQGDQLTGQVNMDVRMNGRMSMIEKGKYEEFKADGNLAIDKMHYNSASFPAGVMINAMNLTFNPKFVELVNFDAKMGKSDIRASGKIDDLLQYVFRDSLLRGNFSMKSAYMDLNELMGPSDTAAAPAAADTAALSVIEIPKNIDFVLNSSIDRLLYDNMDITNVLGVVTVRNARASMDQVKMNLMDGSMVMSGYYDTKNPKKPEFKYNLEINEFDIQKTFKAFNTVQKLAPIGKYSKGKFSTKLSDLNGFLDETMMPDMQTLFAKGSMRAKGVTVDGFEPFLKLAESLKNDKMKTMHFPDIASFFTVKDGRLTMDPFKTKMMNIDAEIGGSTGFDQTIDYKWNLLIPTKDLPSAATETVKGLLSKASALTGKEAKLPEKVEVTALIGGTVTKPVIKTGIKDMMKDVKNEIKEEIKAVIEEKKEEVIKNVKEEAAKEAEKILADAQKQADQLKAEAAKTAEQIRTEGNKKADELQNSGGNMLEKMANKKLAEKLRKETEEKAKKVTDEADAKSNKIMEEARGKADKLKQ